MKEHLEIIQLLITVLALVGNAFHDFFRKIFSSPDKPLPVRISVLNGHADLAVGWACCAVFTVTAGHSIAIAGRNTTISFIPVASLSIGAVIALYIVWFAWQGNRLERALWTLSLASMAVLLLGPGGPFNPIEYDRTGLLLGAPPSTPYEPPLPYWIALPVLTAIFVASFLAEYPRLLDFKRGVGPFVTIASSLGVLVLCMGSGAALVQDVLNNPSTPPRLDGDLAQWVRTSKEQLSPIELQTLYRKASEITLARSYLSRFFATIREIAQTQEADAKPKRTNPTEVRTGEKSSPSERQADMAEVRNQVRDLIGSAFLFPLPEKRAFLEARLPWRHPISADGGKSGLPAPGIEPEQSLITLARFVQRYAAAENEQSYGIVVQDPAASGGSQTDPAARLQADQTYHHMMRNVFPPINSFPARTRLVQQLTLPLNYESAVAFSLYQQAAVASLGNAEAALQQLTNVSPDQLQALYEVPQRSDPGATLGLLLNVLQCDAYQKITSDLKLLTQHPVPFAEGIREIFLDRLEKDNSRLVDLFEELDATTRNDSRQSSANAKLTADVTTGQPSKGQQATEAGKPTDAIQRDKAYGRAYAFAQGLKGCLANEENASRLFSVGGQAGPASQLLSPAVLQFVAYLSKGGKSPSDRQELALRYLRALVDPIRVVWLQQPSPSANEPPRSDKLIPLLMQFDTFSEQGKRGTLQHLAADLYSTGGPFSPSVLGSIVGEASRSSNFGATTGLLLAAVLVFPVFAVAAVVGFAGGRMLLDRSALLEHANREQQLMTPSVSLPESPTAFEGRSSLLLRLKAFSKRGWNTVALVGPRGAGKSEILKKLVQDGRENAIGIWLQAPTVFDDKVLASGVQRRVAETVENRISSYLGLDPLSVRKLRTEAHAISAKLFVLTSITSLGLAYLAYSNIRRLDVSAIWMPVGIVVVLSMSAWVLSGVLLQRPNLGIWLRRSSKSNPHLELLYDRCMVEIFGMDTSTSRKLRWLRGLQSFALAVIPLSLLAVLAPMDMGLFISAYNGPISVPGFGFEALIVLGAAIVFFGLYLYSRALQGQRVRDISWIGAIEGYREFVRFCIDRLNSGALGDGSSWSFMIAIDELDRITDISDLRTVIIRLRGLFEIKGAFYYLSMASDSLASLLRGDERTKTEIDSAFDHIEKVQGLTFEETRNLVNAYLKSRNLTVDHKISTALALLSFGVPRDAMRYCDRALVISQECPNEPLSIASVAKALAVEYTVSNQPSCAATEKRAEGTIVDPPMAPKFLASLAFRIAEYGDALPQNIRDRVMQLGFSNWEGNVSELQLEQAVNELNRECTQLTTLTRAITPGEKS